MGPGTRGGGGFGLRDPIRAPVFYSLKTYGDTLTLDLRISESQKDPPTPGGGSIFELRLSQNPSF